MAGEKQLYKEALSDISKKYKTLIISNIISGLVSLIIGMAVMGAGVYIKAILDNQKYEKEIKNNQDKSIYILCRELKDNLTWSDDSRGIIKYDSNLITEKSTKIVVNSLLAPLKPLQIGAWDLLKINKPNNFLNEETIKSIENYNDEIIFINKIIEIRDLYKIFSNGTTDFGKAMTGYNVMLNEQLKMLDKNIVNTQQSLSNKCNKVNNLKK